MSKRSARNGGARRRASLARDGGAPHPRLFFSSTDLDAIRERSASLLRPQLDALREDAERHLDEAPPCALTGDYEAKADQLQNPFLARVVDFSFLAVVTGEGRYLDAARRWTLALARLPELPGTIDAAAMTCVNCGYPEGWALTALAVGYDWLHPCWSDAERALLRDKIRLLAKVLHDGAVAGEWWTGAYLHHDTWIPLGGLGVGAMSIVDEVPEAVTWAERARKELDAALDWLDADGAWPEGPCGWAFALASVVPFWDAYVRRFPDRRRAVLDHPWLANTWKYRVYTRMPDGRFLAFGDCHEHGGYQTSGYEGAPVLRWLAARYRNPYAQWQAAREWAQRPNPYTAAWEILWTDPTVGEAPPDDLPLGILFDNQQMAYLRTSWEPMGTVLAFRSDSLLGRRATSLFRGDRLEAFNNSTTHVHADANSFGIWSRGAFAVSMAGYGQRETAFQSSLLVNGRGQYSRYGADHPGRPDAQVTAFFSSRAGAFVAGEAARAYPPGLRRFVRRMFLIEPGIVFLHDDVATEGPAQLEWRIQVDGRASVDLSGDGFSSVLEGAKTLARLAGPAGVRLGVATAAHDRGIVMALDRRTTEAQLAAVLLPSLPAIAQPAIVTPTESSFVVDALDVEALAAFSAGEGAPAVPGRLSADGTAAIAWRRACEPWAFLAVASTRLTVDGETLFEASGPVTVSYTPSAGVVTVSAACAVTLSVLSGPGRSVALNVPVGHTSHVVQAGC